MELGTGHDLREHCYSPGKERGVCVKGRRTRQQMLRSQTTQGWAQADRHQGQGQSRMTHGFLDEMTEMQKETTNTERGWPCEIGRASCRERV